MALRKVLEDGAKPLRKISREVTSFDEKLHELINDLMETMDHYDGVGLAAPQVGVLKRLFVMGNIDENEKHQVFVNPEIIEVSGSDTEPEACLSIPGFMALVARPHSVKVKYQDADGNLHIESYSDLKARCICHETDHLNGILYKDLAQGRLMTPSQMEEYLKQHQEVAKDQLTEK